jgi:serine/threonine protein kinase
MADRIGEQIGNYTLTRLLGKGGFAEVYLGEHIYLKTNAAIKVLHVQLTDEEIEKFLREARTIAHLEHPNIVRVFEFGMEGSSPYLVMNYAVNGSLRQRHSHGKQVAIPTVLHYVLQIASALQYIHNQKLIHRDIKPRNLLIGSKNEILLSDFGVALLALSSRHQSIQDMAGTITYMAPEQIQGKPRLASDQYSLGVVIYEWLCGELPFKGTFNEIASQHLLTPPPSLREKIPTISPDIEAVVMKALSKDPQQRFQTILAFAAAFEQACERLPARPAATVDLRKSLIVETTDTPFPIEIVSPLPEGTRSSQKLTLPLPIPNLTLHDIPIGRSATLPQLQLSQADVIEQDTEQRVPLTPSPLPAARQTKQLAVESDLARQWSKPLLQLQTDGFTSTGDVAKDRMDVIAPIVGTPSRGRNKRRRSLIAIMFVLICVMIPAIVFFASNDMQILPSTAVTINFSPKVQVLSTVYSITADPTAKSVDVTHAIIPEKAYTTTKQVTATGPATGQVNCILGVFGCQTGVSPSDVTNLADQERPGVQQALAQAVKQQIASNGGTAITAIKYSDVSITPTPAVGQPGTSVTVTLVEQASIVYYINADVQDVARQMLTRQVQQLGANYTLVSGTAVIGQPRVQKIDAATGRVVLSIAAGGDVVYLFPSSQLKAIQSALRGKTVKDASAYLARQPGVDPSTIRINFTRGVSDTLPNDIQEIKLVPVNASNLPLVQLTMIPTH